MHLLKRKAETHTNFAGYLTVMLIDTYIQNARSSVNGIHVAQIFRRIVQVYQRFLIYYAMKLIHIF